MTLIHIPLLLLFMPPCLKGFVGSLICQVRNENAKILTDCRARGIAHINIRFYADTEVLDLSNNEIEVLRNYQFKELELAILQELILRENSIEEVGKFAFEGLNNLNELDLSYNKIKQLPENVFSSNKRLTVLKISNNPLKQTFPLGTHQLQVLDVSSCYFTKIPLDIIKKPQLLFSLNISNNAIREITTAEIAPAENLQFLSTGNTITCNSNAEQLIDWLIEMNVEFTPFCSSHRHFKYTPSPPNRKILYPLADDSFPSNYPQPADNKCPEEPQQWYQHWGFKLATVVMLAVIIILLLILLHIVVKQWKQESDTSSVEELPPYI